MLEAIVAVAVLAVAGTSVFATVGHQIREAKRLRATMEAHALARYTAGQVMLNELAISNTGQPYDPPFEHYSWHGVLSPADEVGRRILTVTVQWGNGQVRDAREYMPMGRQ